MFLPALGVGLGLGGLNFLSTLWKTGKDKELAEWSARKQDDYSWSHWNAMNAYNHPVEQMKRLREAGLNPLLVYGSGGVTGNTTSGGSVPNVATPEAGSVDLAGSIMNGLAMYQDLASKDIQMQLNDAQTQYTLARAEKVRQDTILARQSPARSSVALNSKGGIWDTVKKFGTLAGAAGTGLATGIKARNLFGKGSSPYYSRSYYAPSSSSPGLFDRIGSKVRAGVSALKNYGSKFLKGAWLWNLFKPQPVY